MFFCGFVPVFCCKELKDSKEREGKLVAQLEEKELISNGIISSCIQFSSMQFNSNYFY